MFNLQAKIRTNGYIGKLMSVFLLACPPRGDAVESNSKCKIS